MRYFNVNLHSMSLLFQAFQLSFQAEFHQEQEYQLINLLLLYHVVATYFNISFLFLKAIIVPIQLTETSRSLRQLSLTHRSTPLSSLLSLLCL